MRTLGGGALLFCFAASGAANTTVSILPNGWAIDAAAGPSVQTGTMPQGAAISGDGATLAVVVSG
jgi:hypothetical protein